MGESKGYGRGGGVIPKVNSYNVSLQLSPLVSFWDCIVRTMRYIYIEQAIMDHCVCKQVQPVARKVKKKNQHGKDEFDRVKQAEKKKRRLEKALATSAAIRAELEKKKQKKLEEQQRLDDEGAAIAEAVAYHVLLGEDSDDDDSSRVMIGEEKGFKMDMFRGESNWSPFTSYVWDDKMGISADLIAAQAVSSLQISENSDGNAFVFNGLFRR